MEETNFFDNLDENHHDPGFLQRLVLRNKENAVDVTNVRDRFSFFIMKHVLTPKAKQYEKFLEFLKKSDTFYAAYYVDRLINVLEDNKKSIIVMNGNEVKLWECDPKKKNMFQEVFQWIVI